MESSMEINSQGIFESIYNATPTAKVAAKKAILQHDPNAIDILEILGLSDV